MAFRPSFNGTCCGSFFIQGCKIICQSNLPCHTLSFHTYYTKQFCSRVWISKQIFQSDTKPDMAIYNHKLLYHPQFLNDYGEQRHMFLKVRETLKASHGWTLKQCSLTKNLGLDLITKGCVLDMLTAFHEIKLDVEKIS